MVVAPPNTDPMGTLLGVLSDPVAYEKRISDLRDLEEAARQRIEEADLRAASLSAQEARIAESQEEARALLDRAERQKQEAAARRAEADQLSAQAAQEMSHLSTQRDEHARAVAEKEQAIAEREASLLSAERDIEASRASLEASADAAMRASIERTQALDARERELSAVAMAYEKRMEHLREIVSEHFTGRDR